MTTSRKKNSRPEPALSNNLPNDSQDLSQSKGFGAGVAAAIAAALLSSLCCLAPLLYLVFGMSVAGLTWLQHFSWLQWPMMVVSLGLLGLGFWRLYFSAKPYCSAHFSLKTMRVLYWLSVPLVVVVLFYPFFLPWVLELLE